MIEKLSTSSGNIQSSALQAAKRELLKRESQQDEQPKIVKPARADENYLPNNETIGTFVRSALAALKQGNVFDRGSIVNLLV